jgi:hypothetical protein
MLIRTCRDETFCELSDWRTSSCAPPRPRAPAPPRTRAPARARAHTHTHTVAADIRIRPVSLGAIKLMWTLNFILWKMIPLAKCHFVNVTLRVSGPNSRLSERSNSLSGLNCVCVGEGEAGLLSGQSECRWPQNFSASWHWSVWSGMKLTAIRLLF